MISCITNCRIFLRNLLEKLKNLFTNQILINNFSKSQKRSFLVVKISLKTLPKKQEIAFESTLNPRASIALRQALDPGRIRALLHSPLCTLYAQGVDKWTLVWTSDFSEPLVHNTSA